MARVPRTLLLGIAVLANLAVGRLITPKDTTFPTPSWNLLPTGSTARFRGLAPVSAKIAWVSGTNNTILHTVDGGHTWASVGPTLSATDTDTDTPLEFRDIEAWSADRAIALSIGAGTSSRIYATSNGGTSWDLAFANADPAAFYDCIAFASAERGMAVSDPVDGKFRLVETRDGGRSWDVVDPAGMPPALGGEAGFAASGTCLATAGGRWYLASGGVDPGRVFRSGDGYHWEVSNASVAGGEGAGVFSVQFRDAENGIAVGGNYSAPAGNVDNAAWSSDGGQTWVPSTTFPGGYRSGSSWVPGRCGVALAVGPTGSDITLDSGRNWHVFDNGSFDSVECISGDVCWASGENGRVARLSLI
ncbi:oxidoreductase [Annulohypoxylon truncatum]|uniref:oxidoreductase n=1 Tax=Annulohypoxylon truncatum TaxID=327061 RepID=UPI002007B509|nr:oxidoreductase [Annulohypoxylon truncatum]KAI1210144.1 oxidoreductase [Annulohypoxylon truncatum]